MGSETDFKDQTRVILLVRTLVAALGERTAPPWWRTQFLTEVGFRAMGRVFPRTAASAALNSVLLAARVDHDQRIGVGERYHLFRLPTNMENALLSLMAESSFATQTTGLVTKRPEELIQDLGTLASERKIVGSEGPIRVGPATILLHSSAIEALAAHYRHSFQTGRRAFPYFADTGGTS